MECGKCFYWIWNGSPFFRIGYCSAGSWEYRRETQKACKFFVEDDGSNPLKSPEHYEKKPRFVQFSLFDEYE